MSFRPLAALLALTLLAPAAFAQVPFTITPYGPTCGPLATGTATPNGGTYRFAFTITNATPRSHVLVIVGVNAQATPLNFGANCLLLTELGFTQTHRTDPAGKYTWSHALGQGVYVDARIQFADFWFDAAGQLQVRTSNGLHFLSD